MCHVYLLQEREFIKTNESVYKIGKTKQDLHKRFGGYPKGSNIIMTYNVSDSDQTEREIIKVFDTKFKNRSDVGREYYEGNIEIMKDEFYETIKKMVNNIMPENNIKCQYCQRRFVNDSNLNHHTKYICKLNPNRITRTELSCSKCRKCFTSQYNNMIIMTESNNICPHCSSHFSTTANLNRHIKYYCTCNSNRIIRDEFMCDKCNKIFSNRYNLERHVQRACKKIENVAPNDEISCLRKEITELREKTSLNANSAIFCMNSQETNL